MAENRLLTRIVIRNDTAANWTTENPTLLKGEAGYETDTQRLKFGDGSTAWNSLAYFGEESVYQIEVASGDDHQTAIETAVGGAIVHNGDVAIVKELIISTEDGTEYRQYTAYVYNGTAWVAMDGNYSADSVIFNGDITATYSFGKYEPDSSGSVTIPSTGKTLAAVLQDALAEEKNPTVTNPAVTARLTNSGTYEVGTNITPSYTASLSAGSYTYGPATGITATAWAISNNTDGSTATTASGTLTSIQVTDSTSYTITAVATHGAGATPVTNLGNAVASLAIAAGTKSATAGTIKGYRGTFYGSLTTAVELTSANIRGLSKRTTSTGNFTLSVAEGSNQVIIAVPPAYKVTAILDANDSNSNIVTAFAESTVSVEGANNYTAQSYNVYTYSPKSALSSDTYTITVAAA